MIKVFTGTEPKTEIARKVLEFSISENTKAKVEFHSLMGKSWRTNPVKGVGTGFSLLRWDIPRRCDYKGSAIYLDADIICLRDIAELWKADVTYPNDEASIWCTYQPSKWFPDKKTPETSVMLIDCERAKINQMNLEEILEFLEGDIKRKKYVQVMRTLLHPVVPQQIPDRFDHLNVYQEKKTVLLHYTKEDRQPWYDPTHALRYVWEEYLIKAVEKGVVTKEEISDAIKVFEPHKKGKRGIGINPYYKKYL